MTLVPTARNRPAEKRFSVQEYAKTAGILGLLSVVAGGIGEYYVPSIIIVSSDAAATAKNIVGSDLWFRVSFAAYLIEAVCDVTLSLIFYVLLRPVRKDIAMLATFFRLLGTALYAVAEFFYIAPLVLLGRADYLRTFTPDQLNALALLSLNLYRYWGAIFTVFSGLGYILLGYLILRSGYLPKLLGAVVSIAGFATATYDFALVLAPAYAFPGLILPVIIAAGSLTLWLMIKGVNVQKWEERVRVSNL